MSVRRRRSVAASCCAVVVLAAAVAVYAVTGASDLPLQPLSAQQPAPDGYRHVLVHVPAGIAAVPQAPSIADAAPSPTPGTGPAGGTGGGAPVPQPAGPPAQLATGPWTAPAKAPAAPLEESTPSAPAPASPRSGGASPSPRSGGAAPGPGGAQPPGVDVAALSRYTDRLVRLERSPSGRVIAVLTDGSTVDVTAEATGDAAAPRNRPDRGTTPPGSAPAEPSTKGKGPSGRRLPVPVPLLPLLERPDVVDVSPVDPQTWRVTGHLSATDVADLTGLPTHDDVLMHLSDTDDTYFPLLWGLKNAGGTVGGFPATADADVDGVEANARSTGAGIVVAVVDSGVQPNHPDLPQLWRNPGETCGNAIDDDHNGYVDDCTGWDFVRRDNTPYDAGDSNDHGTHVSGTIAAVPGNGRGVAGLAPAVTLMSLKITTNGSIYLSDAAEAIRYAADHGARVVNASFGTSPGAPREAVRVLEDAVDYARGKGVVIVAAAGNSGVNTDASPAYPASLPQDNVISVGASTANEQVASFSNYGATSVDLFAPGHYIVSTVDRGGYNALQGTSMAAPHVTAAAALVLAAEPHLTPSQVRQRLIAKADPVGAYAGRSVAGGRLNADQAIAGAKLVVQAAAFHDFVADEPHTGTLTIKAPAAMLPADGRVSVRATLLTAVNGAAYGVLNHPVTLDGAPADTGANAELRLGPADGMLPTDPILTGDGLRVALGTALPAGEYALVVDLVSTDDPQFGFGRPVAVFFSVPTPGQPAQPANPSPTQPAPTAAPAPTDPAPTGAPVAPAPAPTTTTTTAPGTPAPGQPIAPTQAPAPTQPTQAPTTAAPTTAPGGQQPTATTPPAGTAPTATAPPTTAPSSPSPSPSAPSAAPPSGPVTHDGITIAAASPNNGPATGGYGIMITGANFPTFPIVSIGDRAAFVVGHSSVSLTVIVPPGVPGSTADVTVADRTGRAVTLRDGFRYHAEPQAPGATDPPPAPPTTAPPGTSPAQPGPAPTQPAPNQPVPTQPGGGSMPTPITTTAPAQPAPEPTQPTTAPAQPGDGATTPTASPSPQPTGPAGSLPRPAPQYGTPQPHSGLSIAPVTANNPLVVFNPDNWSGWRCADVLCPGVDVP